MQQITFTRKEVADRLGLTYSTLRVYERHLGDLLDLRLGSNRTTLYGTEALETLERAVELKRQGLPFSKLLEYFRGDLAPERSQDQAVLETIRTHTEALLELGRRIEERLRFVERTQQTILAGREFSGPTLRWAQGGERA